MFGLPRRHQPTRRATPSVTLFDPSSDSDCALWVRADVGVSYDARRQFVTGMTSRLANQRGMTCPAGSFWRMPQLSNGFDALQCMPGQFMSAVGVGNGSRYLTTTLVFRMFAYIGAGATFLYLQNNYELRTRYDRFYLYTAAPTAYNWEVSNALIWSHSGIVALTTRQFPYDESGGNLLSRWKINWNTTSVDVYPADSTTNHGSYVLNATDGIGFSLQYTAAIHEFIHWNRKLTDTEVGTMHNLLLSQYSLAG